MHAMGLGPIYDGSKFALIVKPGRYEKKANVHSCLGPPKKLIFVFVLNFVFVFVLHLVACRLMFSFDPYTTVSFSFSFLVFANREENCGIKRDKTRFIQGLIDSVDPR